MQIIFWRKKYFEKLIEKFENDEKLDIASGNSASADIEKIFDLLRRGGVWKI
jgi:hypothetical protein